MFCPDCGSEYRAGFTRCIDCDMDLVDCLPEGPKVEADEDNAGPAIVFVTSDVCEAALVKSLLEASGVKVCSFDENLSRIHPFYSAAIGGIKLAVAPRQEELAQEVLSAYRGKAGESPTTGRIAPFGLSEESQAVESQIESGGTKEHRCPRCDAPLEAEATLCSECGCEL